VIKKLSKRIIEPSILVETGQFIVKLAEDREEVEKAQRLRYEVFNLEQGRGLECAQKYGIDFDEFDEYCLHILVLEKGSGRAIGTYRAHLGCIANSAKGFYSSREYAMKGFYKIADKCIELGRSCVSPEFRTGAAVALLWGAIAELLSRAKLTYMLGCVSLENTDPVIGWALYEYLCQSYSICEEFTAIPRKEFKLERPPEHKTKEILADKDALKKHIPAILKGYLRLGAFICGEPVLDREFGTIDFFILVDINRVPDRYVRHFNYMGNTN